VPVITRIDEEIEKRSLLKHPFYKAWSAGGLTLDQLSGYSREYFQLVKAVPQLVSNLGSFPIAGPAIMGQIQGNLVEERSHIEPWVRFAGSLGVKRADLEGYVGASGTLKAVGTLDSLTRSSFYEGVAAMYAYEKQLPEISRSKIDGLKKHYGIEGGDGTKYFELHEEADVRHAALWREMLATSAVHEGPIVDAAVGSLVAQNSLLDAVVEKYC
jgi:pyrroloquinoline-quinone synthase